MSTPPANSSPAPPEKPAPVQFNQAQQQYQPMPMPQPMYQPYPPKDDVPRPSKTWNISKVILGSFIIVFDIVLLAMGGAMLGMDYSYYNWTLLYIIVACITVVSLAWQIAEFITVCVRRNYIGIHPGAHVGVHLILWLALCALIGITGAIVHYDLGDYKDLQSYLDDDDSYSSYYGYYDVSLSSIRSFLRMEEAELAIAVLLLLCHFTLFILACIETDKRNKAPRVPRTVYVVAPPPGHASVYYAPPPAQGMPQPYPYPPMQFIPQQPEPARVNGDPNPNSNSSSGMYGYYAPAVPPMHAQNGYGSSSRQPPQPPVRHSSSTPVSSVAGPSGSNTHEQVNVERV